MVRVGGSSILTNGRIEQSPFHQKTYADEIPSEDRLRSLSESRRKMNDWRKRIRITLNWKLLLMSLLVNTITIAIVVLLTPGIVLNNYTHGLFILLAIGLGLLNTFIKPILQLLTIRLLFSTYGLVLILVNAGILYLLHTVFKTLQIDSLWAALLGGILMGLISTFLDYIFGVTPPLGYVQTLREEAI
jgi:putative membrane protein